MTQGFDFHQVLQPALQEYLPREALESDIRAEVDNPVAACVLVVGGPGTGKTSLAAHFIDELQCIHHFLRPGHTEFSLWSDPHGFLTSIAFQLRQRFGDDIFPEAVALDVNGQVHTLGSTGSFTGIEVDRLITVPWRRDKLRVDFSGKYVDGSVTGIRINELIEDYRGVPLRAFREMAVIDPLRRIRAIAPDTRLVFWVDGLDEEAIARVEASSPGRSISQILPLGSELGEIGNASLFVSSRRGPHLERFESDGAKVIDLDADVYQDDRRRCVEKIFDQEMHREHTAGIVTQAQWQVEEFKALVVARAADNPLYIRQLFRAIEDSAQRDAILKDREIPMGLSSIQKGLLSRLLPTRRQPEHERTYRILAILSVAYSEFSLDALAAVVNIEPNQAKESIARLAPILRTADNGAVALYHSSLRDLITDGANRGEAWGVDTETAHGSLGDYYFPVDKQARVPDDDYGFEYGTSHLAGGGREARKRLFGMMDCNWREQLRSRSRTNNPFLADLERAWQVMQTSGINQFELPLLACQLGLMHGFVEDAMSEVSNDTLELMTRLGQTNQALQSLPAGETGVVAERRCRAILAGLACDGFQSTVLATELLRKAVQHLQAPNVGDWYFWEIAELLRLGEPGVFPGRPVLEELEQAFYDRPVDSHTCQAFAELARLWSAYDDEAAIFFFDQAAAYAANADDGAKQRLAETWLDFDASTAHEKLGNLNIDVTISPESDGVDALAAEELAEAWNKLYQHRGSGLPPVSVRELVCGQLEQDSNLLEAYGANLADQDLRGQVYCAAAHYYLDSDTERARHYLRRARQAQEFPRSSGPVRHFYYAVAHQIEPDDYDWAEQTLWNTDVNREACAMWRLHMIQRFLPDDFDLGRELFDKELKVWGSEPVNANTICEFPAWISRYGAMYGLIERSEAVLDELEGSIQGRLMSIIVCRYYSSSDPDKVATHLERVFSPTEAGAGRMQEWEILAFAAGQLWNTEHGQALLEQAHTMVDAIVAGIEGDDELSSSRRGDFRATSLATMAMQLHYGNYDAAGQVLSLLAATEPSRFGEEMTFPYPAIPEYRLAGMRWVEYVFATVAAAIGMKDSAAFPTPSNSQYWSAALSLAHSKAAREGLMCDLPQRLSWCSTALANTKKIVEPQLRRLLLGDVASAYIELKANQAALDIVRPLAEEILASREFHISKRMFGHAHALGRCLGVLCRAEHLDEATDLLWRARTMGAGAFYVLMSTLPETLSRLARYSPHYWEAVELKGFDIFPRREAPTQATNLEVS